MTNDGRDSTATSLPMMIEMIYFFSCWLKEFYLNEIDNKKLNIFKREKQRESGERERKGKEKRRRRNLK